MEQFSYKDVVGPLYFTDPDLKEQFPKYPALISGIKRFDADKTTIQFVGNVTSFALYNVTNLQAVNNFLSLCDGSRSLESILSEFSDVGDEDKRNLIAMLFRNGLIEEGSSQEATTESLFFSQLVDNTRLNVNGWQANERLKCTKLGIVGSKHLVKQLAEAFETSGIEEIVVNTVNDEVSYYLILNGYDIDPDIICQLERQAQSVQVMVNIQSASVEFGPVLNSMTDSLSTLLPFSRTQEKILLSNSQCYQIVYRTLLFVSKCNVNKIHAYSAIISPDATTKTSYKVRAKHSWHDESTNEVYQADTLLMEHYAAISVPPMDFLGGKIHEHHSSPMNLAAYHEKPMELFSQHAIKLEKKRELFEQDCDIELLKTILSQTFGYRHTPNGLKRIAPSGGDLGVTEAIVTGVNGSRTVFRYHGMSNSLEVAKEEEDGPSRGASLSIYFYSNMEKAKRKYGQFGENLVRLDAGVSLNYIQSLAAKEGYTLQWESLDGCIPENLKFLQNKTHEFLYKIKLQPSKAGCRAVVRDELYKLIEMRSAGRNFAETNISEEAIDSMLKLARQRYNAIVSNQDAVEEVIYRNIRILVLERGRVNKYELDETQPPESQDVSNYKSGSPVELSNLVNQTTLSASPLKFIISLDMNKDVIAAVDLESYKASLSIASSILMEVWFEALSLGLIACPAGGLSPHSLLENIDPANRNMLLLFTLCVGEES